MTAHLWCPTSGRSLCGLAPEEHNPEAERSAPPCLACEEIAENWTGAVDVCAACAEHDLELVFYDQAGVDRIRGSAPLHENHRPQGTPDA